MNHMGCTRETVRAACLVLWLLGVPLAVGAVDPTAAGVEAADTGAASEGATGPGGAVARATPEETPATTEEAEATITLEPLEVTSSTATKTELPVFETPFTLNTVPSEVIQDQNVILLKDALRNVSSVVSGFENGGNNDNFTIRGFDLKNIVYRDGVRLKIPQIDPANIERIDVLKGAAGSLFGRIEPGGLVNIVTKKPLAEPHYSIEQQIGQFDFYRTEADATGPITEDKAWLYRTVFSYQNNGSFRDTVENEHKFFAPSLTWQPNERTKFHLSFEYSDFDDTIDYGIPAAGGGPAPVPIKNYYGVNGAMSDTKFYLVDFNWSHAFSRDWSVQQKFAWYLRDREYIDSGPQAVNGERVDIFVSFPYDDDYESYFTEIDLTGRFELWGMPHSVLFGSEYYQDETKSRFFSSDSEFESRFDSDGFLPIRPLDLQNPVYQKVSELPAIAFPTYESPFTFGNRGREYWYAVFAQDFVDITDKLRFIFFGRYDIVRDRAGTCLDFDLPIEPCAADTQQIEDEIFTPRIGLGYDLLPWFNVFGNYSESFGSPPTGVPRTEGDARDFERGEQGEIGFKAKLFEERLLANLTFFHLTNSKVTLQVPAAERGGFVSFEQAGEERSRGIELDFTGHVTDHWSVIGSYAYTDARVTKDQRVIPVFDADGNVISTLVTAGAQGQRLPNVPEHAFSLWTKYEFPFGLGLGGGVFGATPREVDSDNTVDVPGFVRVDATVSYRWDIGNSVLTAQFNVLNLLDKEIFDAQSTFTSTINVTPVAPRTFLGSLRLQW